MSLSLHIKIWLIVTIFSLFFVMGTARPDQVFNAIQSDVHSIAAVFGKDEATRIVTRTNDEFSVFFDVSGSSKAVEKMHQSDADGAGVFGWERRVTNSTNQMLRSAKIEVYHMFLRFNIFFIWIPMIVLFCIAGFIDGMMVRKIKIASFRYLNPAFYNTAGHVAIAIFGTSLLLLHLPTSISIWFWPVSGFLESMCIMIAMSNYQRMGL